MSTKNCPSCGAPVALDSTSCKYCGEALQTSQPQYQQPPQYHTPPQYAQGPVYYNRKSKVVAGLLGIFLGGFGIHKFYLGRIGWGIVYLIFCWTYIPAIIGFIEGIVYLASNENNFHMKYSRRM